MNIKEKRYAPYHSSHTILKKNRLTATTTGTIDS